MQEESVASEKPSVTLSNNPWMKKNRHIHKEFLQSKHSKAPSIETKDSRKLNNFNRQGNQLKKTSMHRMTPPESEHQSYMMDPLSESISLIDSNNEFKNEEVGDRNGYGG